MGTVERLDGAKMSMQVPFEASDGSRFLREWEGSSRLMILRMLDWF